MGIIHKTLIVFFSIMSVYLYSSGQIIYTYNLQNISDYDITITIQQFWNETHYKLPDFPVNNISDLSVGKKIDTLDYLIYQPLNLSFFQKIDDSTFFAGRLSHSNIEIEQFIIVCQCKIFLIDMRHPLIDIVNNVSYLHEYTGKFISDIVEEIKYTHKSNWYINHWSDVDTDNLFSNDEDCCVKNYNPNEW